MARQAYIGKSFRQDSLALIADMNAIIGDYLVQGFTLSVRQRYYQLVTPNRIANREREYERVIRLCNDARLAGLMDWDALEDRTREFVRRLRWRSGAEILRVAAEAYHEDRWANQRWRLFCVVEKDALSGVLEPVCGEFDIPLLAARGYPSVTVLREFTIHEILPVLRGAQQSVTILHLGDHNPSGLDMTRDLQERLALFVGQPVRLARIALNRDQIEAQRPPENPAKTTDRRFAEYARRYGTASWELDALPPHYLAERVRTHAAEFIDPERWRQSEQAIRETQARLTEVAEAW